MRPVPILALALTVGLGACFPAQAPTCTDTVSPQDIEKAQAAIEAHIRKHEGPQALRAVTFTYRLTQAKQCDAVVTLHYELRQDQDVAYVGVDRTYRVDLKSGKVENLTVSD